MPTPPPAALLAFLRGLERRARTLTLAQCGDPDRAETIWVETAAAFPAEAATLPVASWPVRFWARLLAHPAMAVANADGSPLAAVGPGPRAALLLRLVAGLDPRPAADVLGVSEPTYRYALQRGLEQARAAGIDADGLRGLRDGWQRQPLPSTPSPAVFAAAPPAQAAVVAPVDTSHAAAESEPEPVLDETDAGPAPRRVGRLVLAAAAAGALLAVGWWATRAPPPPPPVRPVAVAATPTPTVRPPEPVTHPDYALVAAPDDAALAEELGLLSWLAAGAEAAPAEALPTPGPGAAP